jgi:predicted membrane protein
MSHREYRREARAARRAERRAEWHAKWGNGGADGGAFGGPERHLIVGVIAIGLGLLFLLDNLNFFEFRHWIPFWPTVFLLIGAIKISKTDTPSGYMMGVGWIALGALLMLGHFHIVHIGWRVIWPLFLIWLGVVLLTRGRFGNRRWDGFNQDAGNPYHDSPEHGGNAANHDANQDANNGSQPSGATPFAGVSLEKGGDKAGAAGAAGSTGSAGSTGPGATRPAAGAHDEADAVLHANAIFGGFERQVSSQNFRGGEITAILGGCEIDLTRAQIQGEAVLDVFTCFGGITLRVPEDWTVILRGTPILATFVDKARVPLDGSHRLIITGHAILGGVEVRN